MEVDSQMPAISDARVLIVASDGFEESELFGPREILLSRGAEAVLAARSADASESRSARVISPPA